jgi:hypothetical protein
LGRSPPPGSELRIGDSVRLLRIAQGGLQVAMAEPLADGGEAHTSVDDLRCVGMAQLVLGGVETTRSSTRHGHSAAGSRAERSSSATSRTGCTPPQNTTVRSPPTVSASDVSHDSQCASRRLAAVDRSVGALRQAAVVEQDRAAVPRSVAAWIGRLDDDDLTYVHGRRLCTGVAYDVDRQTSGEPQTVVTSLLLNSSYGALDKQRRIAEIGEELIVLHALCDLVRGDLRAGQSRERSGCRLLPGRGRARDDSNQSEAKQSKENEPHRLENTAATTQGGESAAAAAWACEAWASAYPTGLRPSSVKLRPRVGGFFGDDPCVL